MPSFSSSSSPSSFSNSKSSSTISYTRGTVSYAFLELVELTLGFNPLVIKRNEYSKSSSSLRHHHHIPTTTTTSNSSSTLLSSTHAHKNYKLPQLSAQEKLKKIPRSELHATLDSLVDNGTLVTTAVCSFDDDKRIANQEMNTFDRLLALKKKYSHIPFERGLTWSRDAVHILEQLRSLLPGETNPYEGQYSKLVQQFTHLALIGMDITIIDKGVKNFTNLTDFNISQNKDMRILHVRNLPRSLHGITAIGNRIEEIQFHDAFVTAQHALSTPASFADINFPALWSLSLGSNYLSRVPYNIHIMFPHLHVLDISGNEITDLPLLLDTVSQLTELTHLVTYKNPIALGTNYIFHCLDRLPKLQSFDDRPLNNDLRAWISTMVNKIKLSSETTSNDVLPKPSAVAMMDYSFSRILGLPVPSQILSLLHLSKNFNISFLTQPLENDNKFTLPSCTYRLEVKLTSTVNLTTENASFGVPHDTTPSNSVETGPTHGSAPGSKPGTAIPGSKGVPKSSRPGSASKESHPAIDPGSSSLPIDPSLSDSAFGTIQWSSSKHSLTIESTVELCRNIRFAHLTVALIETAVVSSTSSSESTNSDSDLTSQHTPNTDSDSTTVDRIIATGKIMLSGLAEPTDKGSLTVDLTNVPLSLETVPTPCLAILDHLGEAITNPSLYPVSVQNDLSNCDTVWNNDKRKRIIKELCSTSKVHLEYGSVTLCLHKV